MKAITLWQPWASFIALGWKPIETRTHDRFKNLTGERIGIHAGCKWDEYWIELAREYITVEQFKITEQLYMNFKSKFPHANFGIKGAIICTARVFDASWLSPCNSKSSLLKINNDHERFGLFLCDTKPIKPIKVKGHQGIWNYDFKEGELIYL